MDGRGDDLLRRGPLEHVLEPAALAVDERAAPPHLDHLLLNGAQAFGPELASLGHRIKRLEGAERLAVVVGLAGGGAVGVAVERLGMFPEAGDQFDDQDVGYGALPWDGPAVAEPLVDEPVVLLAALLAVVFAEPMIHAVERDDGAVGGPVVTVLRDSGGRGHDGLRGEKRSVTVSDFGLQPSLPARAGNASRAFGLGCRKWAIQGSNL